MRRKSLMASKFLRFQRAHGQKLSLLRKKPISNVPTTKLSSFDEIGEEENLKDLDDEDEMMPEEDRDTDVEDDEDFDEDKLTEESYRTTFDTNPEDLEMQADEVGEDVDF